MAIKLKWKLKLLLKKKIVVQTVTEHRTLKDLEKIDHKVNSSPKMKPRNQDYVDILAQTIKKVKRVSK